MKKRAFVRYSKQGKVVPGSMILTGGSYPKGPAIWKEVPVDLCCTTSSNCVILQGIGQPGEGTYFYGFTLQVRNGGPNLTGTIHWTPTQSENFSLPATGDDYDFQYDFQDNLPHTVRLCIDNPSQIRDFELGFGPGDTVSLNNAIALNGIEEWDGDDMNVYSLDLTGLSSMDQLYHSNTNLTHINITGCINLIDISLWFNSLTEASVDHLLITLDNNGLTNGFIDISSGTNSAPSVIGATAVSNLISKGWSVSTN